jgi:glycosyltransferase involved in cell wall biosynthesis
VAGVLARHFEEAVLYTSAHRRDIVPLPPVGGREWQTSFLQALVPRVGLKATLPLLPAAIGSLPTRDCDLLISSSSAFGHHARKGSSSLHVCVCHTPPRFLWEQDDYFSGRPAQRVALAPLLTLLRRLDRRAAGRVDAYIAVSGHVARRIRRVYGRSAQVVYPPVDTAAYEPSNERSGRFLVLSRLVRSKHVDLVIAAANSHGFPLDIIGTGPELPRLRRLAGPNVRVLGWQPDAVAHEALARCEAVVIAGEEDFGLVTVEAQASGRAPVAFAAGGALEVVEDGTTGYLFTQQTPEAIAAAMLRAASHRLDSSDLMASARRFGLAAFLERLDEAIAAAQARGARAVPDTEALAPEAAS